MIPNRNKIVEEIKKDLKNKIEFDKVRILEPRERHEELYKSGVDFLRRVVIEQMGADKKKIEEVFGNLNSELKTYLIALKASNVEYDKGEIKNDNATKH